MDILKKIVGEAYFELEKEDRVIVLNLFYEWIANAIVQIAIFAFAFIGIVITIMAILSPILGRWGY